MCLYFYVHINVSMYMLSGIIANMTKYGKSRMDNTILEYTAVKLYIIILIYIYIYL